MEVEFKKPPVPTADSSAGPHPALHRHQPASRELQGHLSTLRFSFHLWRSTTDPTRKFFRAESPGAAEAA